MVAAVFAVVFGIWFAVSWRRERRLLRNGVLLLLTIWSVLSAALDLAVRLPALGEWAGVAALLLVPLSVVTLAGFLVANGVTMVRKESRSLGNLLSLVAGAAFIALPIWAVLMVMTGQPALVGLAALVFFVCSYLGTVFASFLCYSIAYALARPRDNAGAIVVLGSGLIGGSISPLLRARLDRGIAEWKRQRAGRVVPFFIPSGGQGPGESRPEGEAMAEYVREQDVPSGVVVPETESRTSEENMVFSQDLLLRRGGSGHLTVVTSNYHVPRAALLSKRLGIDADVVGSRTARYYVPSAYLREFVAVLTYHTKLHLFLLAPVLLGTTSLTILFSMSLAS